MNGWRALVYLDACRIRNTALNIVRKPVRLLPWLLIVVWFSLSLFTSHLRANSGHASPFPTIHALTTLIGGIILVVLAVGMITTASSGRLVGARDPADAYFLARSAISEPIVFLWLQIRAHAILLVRATIMLIVFTFTFAGRNATAMYLALAGVGLLVNAIAIPAFFVARRFKLATHAVGMTIALVGLALVVIAGIDMAFPSPAHDAMLLWIPAGRYVDQLAAGSTAALLVLYGATLACIVFGAVCSSDMYPDIYSSARLLSSALERVRSRRFEAPVSRRQSRSGMRTALRGPYAEIWKQLAFMRRANGVMIVTIGLAVAMLIGGASGYALVRNEALGLSMLTTTMLLLVMFLAMGGTSLASDILKPLWWLGDGNTFEKLLGWTIGSTIPSASFVGLMMGTAAIASRSLTVAVVGLMTTLALPFALRGIGVFVYSLIPSGADQRGPGMGFRLLLLYVALAPAIAAAIAVGIMVPNIAEGPYIAIVVVLGIESALALYFAARRIEGRGVEFAFAEKQ